MFTEGATAVVVGGARGIGRATVRDLAAHDVRVVVGYSNSADQAADLVEEIVADGGDAVAHHVDVTDEAAVQQMFRWVRGEFGRLDVLVNSAGITKDGFLGSMSRGKFDDVMAVNMFGTFLTCREAVKVMAHQRFGSIVNVASAAFARGVQGQSNYCASKGAVVAFTRALAKETAQFGVRANVVAPGYVDTAMIRSVDPSRAKGVPLGRFGQPDEIAALVTFLASHRASYMTGSIVVIDGGTGE